MKTMKKLWMTICSFLFVLALGFGITLNVDVKAKAATGTATAVNVTYAAVVERTEGHQLHLVVDVSTPEGGYEFPVYVDGRQVTAWTNSGTFILNNDDLKWETGDTILLEIPAGTNYQSNAYLSNDIAIVLKHGGVGKAADRMAAISGDPYSIELYRVDWAMNANAANALYVNIPNSSGVIKCGVDTENWSDCAKYVPFGNSLLLNGTPVSIAIQKVYGDTSSHASAAYMAISGAATAGDVLTFDGWFADANQGAFYLEETTFIYDGKSWEEAKSGSHDMEFYGIIDANAANGFYFSMAPNHIPVSDTDSGWTFSTLPVGTNHYATYTSGGTTTTYKIGLNKIGATQWYAQVGSAVSAVAGDTVVFGGWYYCLSFKTIKNDDGSMNWDEFNNLEEAAKEYAYHHIYIPKTKYTFTGTEWVNVTPEISVTYNSEALESDYICVEPGTATSVLEASSEVDTVTVNYGDLTGDTFVLRSGESSSEYVVTFSVTENGVVYTRPVTVCVGYEDFTMEEGASVRVVDDNVNGLRFIGEMSAATYTKFQNQDQNATYGVVIVPRDYITEGYELTSKNLFGANAKYSETAKSGVSQAVRLMVHIKNAKPVDTDGDGNYEIYGAIDTIRTNNLTREFVGVAYACVGGEYILADFYGDDMDNNARSIYYVSQKAIDKNDHASAVQNKYISVYDDYLDGKGKTYNVTYTVNHIKDGVIADVEKVTAPLNSVVTIQANEYVNYACNTHSITSKLYVNKPNVFNIYYEDISVYMENMAWHHPTLDTDNNYLNDTNKTRIEAMKAAGITAVVLGNATDPYMFSKYSVEEVKGIINAFWTYGNIKTIVTGKNSGERSNMLVGLEHHDQIDPDFSDCEGFGGFLAWDEPEPTADEMEYLAEYAAWYDALYGANGTYDTPFWVNLLPSYYDEWGSDGHYANYETYVKAYCDTVLAEIKNGTKFLSVDTYPIKDDGTLMQEFLYDLAVLKYYAKENGAHAHAILQGCGWSNSDGTDTDHSAAPTEAQYRLMMYSALAFGMDSISWWGFAPEREDNPICTDTPIATDGSANTAYAALQNVNAELATFDEIYKGYTWQGVIMSEAQKGGFSMQTFTTWAADAQYNAYKKVKDFNKNILTEAPSFTFTKTEDDVTVDDDGNYLIGVMKNGDQYAYTVVNYSAPTDGDEVLTLTLTTSASFNIYKGTTVTTGQTGTITLTLNPGEGAFLVQSDATANVTFKNYDGTVLQSGAVALGATPTYSGATPTRAGYQFVGWTPALGAVTCDTVYTAVFEKVATVTFQNWDGTVLQSGTVDLGTTPTYNGATPTKDGYEFIGWTPEISVVTGDVTYTAVYNSGYDVTYLNWDGTATPKTEEIKIGGTVSYEPELDGYIFNGWLLNGEPYDVSTPVAGDITLVASWMKEIDSTKTEISAEEVSTTVTREGFTSQVSYGQEANWKWYYDTDYLFDMKQDNELEENRLWDRAMFVANSTNVGDNKISLPKINYSMYDKVDFGFVSSINTSKGNITDVQINGVSGVGYDNRLIHIAPGGDGKYYATVYKVNDLTVLLKVELPEAIVNGTEALTINVVTDGAAYAWVKISEIHMTTTLADYMTDIEKAVATLESDPTNESAVNAYYAAREYMTAYEKANNETPDVVIVAKANVLYSAVENATAASQAQIDAINEFRAFDATLTEEEKNIEAYRIVVAKVNSIVYNNFYELGDETTIDYTPTIAGSGVANNGKGTTSWRGGYVSTYSTFNKMKYQSGGNATFTLPATNYNMYAEVYFGIGGIVADNLGTITIEGKSISFNNSSARAYKVVIAGGILTLSKDHTSDGVDEVFKVALPEDVINGETGLVINFEFGAYAEAEVTEMHVVPLVMSETAVKNVASIVCDGGSIQNNVTIAGQFATSEYTTYSYVQLQDAASAQTAVITLNAFPYAAYEEVCFGVAFAETVAGGGILTIGGESLVVPSGLLGHWYKMKAVIIDGYLTLIDAGCSNDIKTKDTNYTQYGYFLKVKLSDSVLNGTEGLVISFAMQPSYARIEVTSAIAYNKTLKSDTAEQVLLNDPIVDTTKGAVDQGERIQTGWGGHNTNYNTAYETYVHMIQFTSGDYDGTVTLPAINYNQYGEVYFGVYAISNENATVTIGGETLSFFRAGKNYKVVIANGTLKVYNDQKDGDNALLAETTLSADVLNGTTGLVIDFTFECWSQAEITEMHVVGITPIQ